MVHSFIFYLLASLCDPTGGFSLPTFAYNILFIKEKFSVFPQISHEAMPFS